MYAWLSDLPADRSVHIVTPNRRLARVLREAWGQRQLEAGRAAWQTPAVYALRDWYAVLAAALPPGRDGSVRVGEQQSRVLWEACLRAEIEDPFVNIASLSRLCRDTWERLKDWQVPLERVARSAGSADQYLFARAAARYRESLASFGYVDAATLPDDLRVALARGDADLPAAVWCCGFDRLTPQFMALRQVLEARGVAVGDIAPPVAALPELLVYPNPEAELRAAGAWARRHLDREPDQVIGIVVTRLEQAAAHSAALVREGFVPGWQLGGERLAAAVDLSFGERLAELPAVSVALLALRWLRQAQAGADVARLLRSPWLGIGDLGGRSRLELKLRDRPDRQWSVDALLGFCRQFDRSPDADDWLTRFGRARELAAAAREEQGPVHWAELFEAELACLGWPGTSALSSDDYQLDNRWRKLLNEFARLELVLPRIGGREAIARLGAMAADTVFQPEASAARVTVLGPLEAAGLEFDRLWITGAVATEWPPASRPLALVARDLQREFELPDASPEDTATFARRVLSRIVASAGDCTMSYPALVGDAEQAPTRLLGRLEPQPGSGDPGWHASGFAGTGRLQAVVDRVPPVLAGERVSGGAGTVQRQAEEPFSAFATGRLGIRALMPFFSGVAANVRGNLVHATLARLYAGLPDQAAVRSWSPAECTARIAAAVEGAYRPAERFADAVLQELFALERERTTALLELVIDCDREREPFAIAAVETGIDAVLAGLPLSLRCDRLDRVANGARVVLDYKTGQRRKLIVRDEPTAVQLIVYTCALKADVDGLALFHVAARETAIDGVGPAFGSPDEWPERLAQWQATVYRHAGDMARGDVRLNARQGLEDARPLGILSRYAEVYRGD